jgi:RNA polymerase sigma factor (TIGR02999 family)
MPDPAPAPAALDIETPAEGPAGLAPELPADLPADVSADITQWLAQLNQDGSTAAGGGAVDHLFTALYAELKRSARAQIRKEYAGHTLSATALTHEAWFRLAEQTRTRWQSRGHFLGLAALMMRRILVNHAVAKQALKRDVPLVSLTLTEAQQVAGAGVDGDVLRVHEALLAFEQVDARAAKVVELKFFGGLEIDEIAELLGVGSATVKRDWALARAWLHRELGG